MGEMLASVSSATPAPMRVPAAGAVRAVHPFRAILRRTFWETFYVTIGAWCVFLLWITEELYSASSGFTMPVRHRDTLMDPAALWLAAFGCAAVGFVLALVQFRGLRAFEQWALLVHRPVSRSWLFVLSSLAGLGIYAVTVGVPLVSFVCWAVATPQATPTFYWGFLYPYAAGVINGVVCYFCGALIMQRQARWFATRFVPLVGGILFLALTLVAREFSTVLVAEVIGAVVFALAAWGSVISQGTFHRVPWAARAGLVLALFSGCVLMAFFIPPLWKGGSDSFAIAYYAPPPQAESYVTAVPVPLADGTLAIRVGTYKKMESGRYALESEQFRTFADAPLPDAKRMEMYGPAAFSSIPEEESTYNYRSLESIVSPDRRWKEIRMRWLEESAAAVGAIKIPPGERVNGIATVHQSFWPMDVKDPGALSDDELSRWMQGAHPWDVVATDKHLYFYDRLTHESAVLPVTHALRDFALNVAVSLDTQHILLTYHTTGGGSPLVSSFTRFVGGPIGGMELYDVSGKLLSTVPLNSREPVLEKYSRGLDDEGRRRLRTLGFLGGFPQGAGMLIWDIPLYNWLNIPITSGDYFDFGGLLTFNFLTAAALVLLARRYRLSWPVAVGWGLAGLVLGPLMVIVFVGAYHWPTRVVCATCGHRRPVNEGVCPHCGVGFAMPAANGTEIIVA